MPKKPYNTQIDALEGVKTHNKNTQIDKHICQDCQYEDHLQTQRLKCWISDCNQNYNNPDPVPIPEQRDLQITSNKTYSIQNKHLE